MTNEEIIALLNEDLLWEHAAIVQYMKLAYSLGEGEAACEIEEVAREEMRHYKHLGEAIAALGGVPTMERGPLQLGGDSAVEWLKINAESEAETIQRLEQTIPTVPDENIRKLLERIKADEQAHCDIFQGLIAKAQAEPAEFVLNPPRAGLTPEEQLVINFLNDDVRGEYSAVLQYLHQMFATPYCEVKRDLEDRAIEEMKHIGWLSEMVAEKGGVPDIERGRIDVPPETEDMLRADIGIERSAVEQYQSHIDHIEDPEAQKLLVRIRDQETGHTEQLTDLLEKIQGKQETPSAPEEPSPAPKTEKPLTVGSLLGQKQS